MAKYSKLSDQYSFYQVQFHLLTRWLKNWMAILAARRIAMLSGDDRESSLLFLCISVVVQRFKLLLDTLQN